MVLHSATSESTIAQADRTSQDDGDNVRTPAANTVHTSHGQSKPPHRVARLRDLPARRAAARTTSQASATAAPPVHSFTASTRHTPATVSDYSTRPCPVRSLIGDWSHLRSIVPRCTTTYENIAAMHVNGYKRTSAGQHCEIIICSKVSLM